MKILNLTAAVKTALNEQRTKLSAALAAIVKANQGLARLEKQQADLIAEIAALETAKPDNKEAVRSLGEKRTELELVMRRIAEVPSVDVEADGELLALTREVARMMEKALTDTEDEYVSGIASGLLPYSLDSNQATYLARQTAAAASLAGRVHARFGSYGYGQPVPAARMALQALDEVLTGELNWSFTPKA